MMDDTNLDASDAVEATVAPPSDAFVYMVLLVDDQAIVAEAVRRMLADQPDLDFHYCGHPAEAMAVVERLKPTVILQDLIMPGVDGLTLVRQYRASMVARDIPVIVLSIREDPIVKNEAFNAGANDYLVKLPDQVELIARIRLHARAHLLQLQRDHAYVALRESQRQLTRSNAALWSLNQQLEKATSMKSAFLANMSHEIRTPMIGVLGLATLLLETPLAADQLEFVALIRQSGNTLLTLINDILDLSKIESGRIDLDAAPFNLRQCFEDAMQLLAPAAAEKGLDLVLLIAPPVPALVIGDVTRLSQVLINLIGNAVKFTAHGEVVISVDVEAGADLAAPWLHVAVADTGIGIPAGKIDSLFQPFGQVDSSTTRRFGGTGLGLVISRRLAEIMGGDLQVESTPELGSTFHLRVIMATAWGEAPPWTQGAPVLRGKRVLLVDDNAAQRRALAQFAAMWGMVLTETDSVSAAELILTASPASFDLLTIDQQLLETSGPTTGTRLRALPGSAGASVLLLSRKRPGADQMTALGADACVVTPLRPAPLLRNIVGLLTPRPSTIDPAAPVAPDVRARLADRLPLRLLLADDNSVNRKVAAGMLKKFGYSVDVVGTGAEVLRALDIRPYDLIFMDLQMPEMDGLEAARRVRSRWSTRESDRPRIIAMTSSASQSDRDLSLEAGMDDYISKPFTADTLREALERWGPRKG